MSYNVSVGNFSGNMTSNVNSMWDRAMPELNLRDMNGRPAAECLPHLEAGISYMAANRHSLEEDNPDNGWGSFGGALSFLIQIADGCKSDMSDTVHVHC